MHLYTDILKKSFFITWKNRFLWFFGFFATLFSGIEVYQVLLNRQYNPRYFGFLTTWIRLKELGFFTSKFWISFFHFIQNNPIDFLILLFIIFIFVSILGFIVWLSIVSQVGIVENSYNIEFKKKANIQVGVESGIDNFWAVLFLNLFVKFSNFLILFIFGLFFLKINTGLMWSTTYTVLYMISFVIAIPFMAIISIIARYAINYIVIEGKRLKDAFFLAIKLFFANWLASFEMIFLLLLIGLIYSGFIFSILSVITVPVLFVTGLLVGIFNIMSIWVIIIITVLLSILLSFAIAFFISFQITAWTLFFLKINLDEGVVSKIMRLVQNHN